MKHMTETAQQPIRPVSDSGGMETTTRGSQVLTHLAAVAFLFALLVALVCLLEQNSLALAVGYAFFRAGPHLILSPLELVLPSASPRKDRAAWWMHLKINMLFFLGDTLVGTGFLAIFGDLLKRVEPLFDLRVVEGRNPAILVLAVLISAVIADFFGYWYHRFQHTNKFMWQHHKLHHSDTRFDLQTSLRNNWCEGLLGSFLVLVPITLLFKFDNVDPLKSGLAFGAGLFIWNVVRWWGHLNVRLHIGWLAYVITGPQAHRIHHSLENHHLDKNFGFFPIWDILFGTFHYPTQNEYPPTGVHGEKEISSVWESQIFTVREWWRFFRRAPDKAPDTA